MKHARDPMEKRWWDPKWLAPAHAELRKIQQIIEFREFGFTSNSSYSEIFLPAAPKSKLEQNWNLKFCLGSQNQDHTLV